MENTLKDVIDIQDGIGPNGLVIIKDKDGNILVRKHNMVVSSGKKWVFERCNWKGTEGLPSMFYRIVFGSNQSETTYTYSTLDLAKDGSTDYQYEINSDNFQEFSEPDHPYYLFSLTGIKCDPSKADYLSCLSITYKDVNGNENLFSRIRFDKIPMVEGNELSLNYYIYF